MVIPTQDVIKKFTLDNAKKAFYLFSIVISTMIFLQNYYVNRQIDILQHRADVRDAYFNKGLIDGAKDREKAYFEMRNQYERILNHCRTTECHLPNDLTILPIERQFDSLESILTKVKE